MTKTFDMYAGERLTDLLHSKVWVFSFQLLVHGISKDDPAIHWARRLLDAGGRVAQLYSRLLGRLYSGVCACLEVKVGIPVLWHLDDCLTAVTAVRKREGDRLPHLLGQTMLEILHEHIAKELLNVALEKNHSISMVPAMHASIKCALKPCHGVSVRSGGGKYLFGGRR